MSRHAFPISFLTDMQTHGTILVFLLAMLLYPHVQVKAQEEIDQVIGNGRLPDFGDREYLPYVEAICLETLRWHPVAPLSKFHRPAEITRLRYWQISHT